MDARDPDAAPLPARSQPLLAAAVACGLVAMAAWYAVSGGLRGGLVHHDAPPADRGGFSVNINTAGAAELAQLPGLGPATAARIVEHRRTHGPFTDVEEVLAVPGIGEATLDRLRPHLRPIRPAGAPAATAER